MITTSVTAGWTSCLLCYMQGDGFANAQESRTTPDLKIAIGMGGEFAFDCFSDTRSQSTIFHRGTVRLIPNDEMRRFGWRNRTPSPFRVAFLFMPPSIILQAAETGRHSGQRLLADLASILVEEEQIVGSVVASLVRAVKAGAPDIYAETGLRWLAIHLVSRSKGRSASGFSTGDAFALTDARLARAVTFMTAKLAQPISVAEIAREAGVSPFHFSRLFARRFGLPPRAYLTRCRMEKALRLLATTNLPIGVVAAECGYPVDSSFSSAFARQFGQTPSAVRHRGCEPR